MTDTTPEPSQLEMVARLAAEAAVRVYALRLAAIEDHLAALKLPADPAPRLAAIEDRLSGIEGRLTAPAPAPPDYGPRLAALEDRPADPAPAPAPPDDYPTFKGRLATIEYKLGIVTPWHASSAQ